MWSLYVAYLSTIGTSSVVVNAVNTRRDRCIGSSRPISSPTAASISSTVPRPFMLIPTVNDSFLVNPLMYAPPPAPASFPIVAAIMSAKRKRGAFPNTSKLDLKATLRINIGPKNPWLIVWKRYKVQTS